MAFLRTDLLHPHPSKHEAKLSAWIIQWAQGEGLAVKQDKVGNIIIKKPATPGMENRKAVVLQAHIDMVPQANADTKHDFATDPIDAYVDGEWVTARGTTLGADNGIGMAGCLAVLADKTIKHGPLEVLLTTDEETGMTGAFGLEAGWLEGEILLNTDSEEDGEVYMGCAGGVDANIRFPLELVDAAEGEAFELAVKGCAAVTPVATFIAVVATPTSCWCVCSKQPSRWVFVWPRSTAAPCATPSRAKPVPP